VRSFFALALLQHENGPFGVDGFIAAIIGGFGSAPAALAGGILLGDRRVRRRL